MTFHVEQKLSKSSFTPGMLEQMSAAITQRTGHQSASVLKPVNISRPAAVQTSFLSLLYLST